MKYFDQNKKVKLIESYSLQASEVKTHNIIKINS